MNRSGIGGGRAGRRRHGGHRLARPRGCRAARRRIVVGRPRRQPVTGIGTGCARPRPARAPAPAAPRARPVRPAQATPAARRPRVPAGTAAARAAGHRRPARRATDRISTRARRPAATSSAPSSATAGAPSLHCPPRGSTWPAAASASSGASASVPSASATSSITTNSGAVFEIVDEPPHVPVLAFEHHRDPDLLQGAFVVRVRLVAAALVAQARIAGQLREARIGDAPRAGEIRRQHLAVELASAPTSARSLLGEHRARRGVLPLARPRAAACATCVRCSPVADARATADRPRARRRTTFTRGQRPRAARRRRATPRRMRRSSGVIGRSPPPPATRPPPRARPVHAPQRRLEQALFVDRSSRDSTSPNARSPRAPR